MLSLSNLIGKTIFHIKYEYFQENGLQGFCSYVKLEDDTIFSLFNCDEIVYYLNEANIAYFKEKFDKGEEVEEFAKKKILRQKIEDIYSFYHMNEIDDDKSLVLKLNNGIYLTEINYRPVGIAVGLCIYNEIEFNDFQKRYVTNKDYQIKSYLEN
ncbi:hypothetical protein WAF17_06340 [Bernardetia sp. ABR2-2B]|uniref:hypothetical protein n=1 Tax=Bernardetia sp. ABR2-2B TaxID=3127472 RepID=UPI0030CAEF2B